MKKPKFDLVLYGASSFVGQLLARELLQRFPPNAGTLRWALAGRSRTKLEQVRAELGAAATDLPILLADAADEPALMAMCEQTRAVVSTVGPYALYGEALLRVCAESGTDYCDLTGESQWIQRMLGRYEAVAQRSGARIVHCCGFDSVPSDLGLWWLQQRAIEQFGQPCVSVAMRVQRMRGGFSGGTAASILNAVREAVGNAEVRRGLANPYWLCPARPADAAPRAQQFDQKFARYDAGFRSWTAPFVMSAINTRIVQRSHALAGLPWGVDFRYDEALLTGPGMGGRLKAVAVSTGLAAFVSAAALPPSRWVLQKLLLPAAGEGPSPEAQLKGSYELRFLGRTADAREIRMKLTGDRDPGYGSTARMLAEAASLLATLGDQKRLAGGFWTPSTAFGQSLVDRLVAHAGIRFELG